MNPTTENMTSVSLRVSSIASTDSEFLPKIVSYISPLATDLQKEHEEIYRGRFFTTSPSPSKLHWKGSDSLFRDVVFAQYESETLIRSDIKEGDLVLWRVFLESASYSILRKASGGYMGAWEDKYQQESSAFYQNLLEELGKKIEALFESAKEQIFEDGMESEFSKELVFLVKKHSHIAIEMLASLIINEKVNAEAASEALRWLGHINHPQSYYDRLWLLERCLLCSSARVRDGAVLGLASLDDPHAVPYLKKAIQQERCAELREDMEQVLKQLENR